MNRQEYLDEIKDKLLGLSEEDIDKALDFYMEAIDDRIDDGLTEEQAIKAVGTSDEVAEQILMDTPLPKLVSATVKPQRKLKVWEIILIVLGAPVWIPIAIALLSVALAVFITLFALMFALAAVLIGFVISGIALLIMAVIAVFAGGAGTALLKFAVGLVAIGVGILLFIPVKAAVLWLIELCGRFFKWIKKQFVKRKNSKK
ncbi:MAG: DUF1700 domain-containing protein [Clostridiales bacterium]|nr:DUF1700 domain-containing protein [Clostridiales bacterium]